MRYLITCATIALAVLPGALAPARGAETAIAAKGLTKEQFDALPDSAVLEVRGRTWTAAELRALGARNTAANAALMPALREKARIALATAQSEFLSAEKKRVEDASGLVRGVFSSRDQPGAGASADRHKDDKAKPTITKIHGTVEPGATVHVDGKDFGSDRGHVRLEGLPGGDRTLAFDQNVSAPWDPTGIVVIIPDVEKVLDQTVSLVVVRKDGISSAPKSVRFKAALEVTSAFPNVVVSCGQDATDNACLVFDFFEGTHIENTFWETDAVACDQFHATAKSPWKFDHFQISDSSSGGEVGHPGEEPSGDGYSWNMCWTVDGAGPDSGNHATYVGYLMIKGPKGVPSF